MLEPLDPEVLRDRLGKLMFAIVPEDLEKQAFLRISYGNCEDHGHKHECLGGFDCIICGKINVVDRHPERLIVSSDDIRRRQ